MVFVQTGDFLDYEARPKPNNYSANTQTDVATLDIKINPGMLVNTSYYIKSVMIEKCNVIQCAFNMNELII